ncbi:hypothetical protein HK100_009386 [Physocladia obscura]|uniref:Uncharacterized protein n=1 Tax=Physocladia obscura TaxID=109957 RepID=A0AAD5XF54_9FUNG|nr:hypothetical protein HK100_009386 [Physocladia obscura]
MSVIISPTAPIVTGTADMVMAVNCAVIGSNPGGHSEMIWYNDLARSKSQNPPSGPANPGVTDSSALAIVVAPYTNYVVWEGQELSATYPDGDTLVFDIAYRPPFEEYAGTAHNNYHGWNCYSDDLRVVYQYNYSGSKNKTCYAVYYCE